MRRFILFLPCILLLSACKKDDPKDLIIGSWKAQSLSTKNCTNAEDAQNLTFSSGCFTEPSVGVQICISANFSSNGSYDFIFKTTIFGTTETETEQGTYVINGNTLSLCPSGSTCEDGQINISENTIVLSSVDADTGCDTILTLVK